jgi:hypothetical protein
MLSVAATLGATAIAGHPASPSPDLPHINWWTGEGVNLGGILFPEFHYQAAFGTSTAQPADLELGRHDPSDHGLSQQNFELALGVRLGDRIRLFGSYDARFDRDDHWDGEFTEFYAEIRDLPLGATLKAGRFQPRFGWQNELHSYAFTMVDKDLPYGRMFGPDPLSLYGAEVALPLLRGLSERWSDQLTLGFGSVADGRIPLHTSDHQRAKFDARDAAFDDWAATADYTLHFDRTPAQRYSGGVSAVIGHNAGGHTTQLYGAHFEYLWRPSAAPARDGKAVRDLDGKESVALGETGEFFRWRTEVLLRHFRADGEEETDDVETAGGLPAQPEKTQLVRRLVGTRVDTQNETVIPIFKTERVVVQRARAAVPGRRVQKSAERTLHDDFTDVGVTTTLTYGFPGGKTRAHLRGEYVSGLANAEQSERWRVSPAVTWQPTPGAPVQLKLQYNYDHSPSFGDEHSVWAQFSYAWGNAK